METTVGKITAEDPSPPAGGAGGTPTKTDQTAPDPTALARWTLLGLFLLAIALAIFLNKGDYTAGAFGPSKQESADFTLFAAFYVAAQAIAAVMAVITPILPPWGPPLKVLPNGSTEPYAPEAQAAYLKADRGVLVLGIAAVLGVILSAKFGLFFLQAVGVTSASNTLDVIFTGFIIAAGVKPLNEFLGYIQKPNNPTTATGTSTS